MESKPNRMLHAPLAKLKASIRVGQKLLLLVLICSGTACSHLKDTTSDLTPYLHSSDEAQQYRLRTGDIIQLDVFQEPIMTGRQRILSDGTIFVGLIGRVNVGGETIDSAATKIANILNQKQLVNPQVNITVLAYSASRFTVWGQVKMPGSYVIPPEEIVNLPTAISMAGGNTVIGSIKRVLVTRQIGSEVKRFAE